MKRIFPLIVIFSILICCLAFPASAANDFNSFDFTVRTPYFYNVFTSGNQETGVVSCRIRFGKMYFQDLTPSDYVSNPAWVDVRNNYEYTPMYETLGYPADREQYISISCPKFDLPFNSSALDQFYLAVDFETSSYGYYTDYYVATIRFYDARGNVWEKQQHGYTENDCDGYVIFSSTVSSSDPGYIVIPNSAVSWRFYLNIYSTDNLMNRHEALEIYSLNSSITMVWDTNRISMSYDEIQDLLDKSNQGIGNIEDSLTGPSGNGGNGVGDSGTADIADVSNSLSDYVDIWFSDMTTFWGEASDLLFRSESYFYAFSLILSDLLGIGFLNSLIHLSLAFGVFIPLFNLVINASSVSHANERSYGRHH